MVFTPVAASISTSCTLSAMGMRSGWPMPSNWNPSRGPTSTMATVFGSDDGMVLLLPGL